MTTFEYDAGIQLKEDNAIALILAEFCNSHSKGLLRVFMFCFFSLGDNWGLELQCE